MALYSLFYALRLNADVALSDGDGAVLERSLDKSNVAAIGFVYFRGIPLTEAVSANTLKAERVADDGKRFLRSSLGDGKDQVFSADAVSQTAVLDMLSDHQRNGEDAPLSRFFLFSEKRVPPCFFVGI